MTCTAPPSPRTARRQVAAAVLAQVAFALAVYAPLANVLPRRVLEFTGEEKAPSTLGVVAGMGALVAVVTSIGVGALSDRAVARGGSRRPWVVVGLVLTPVGLVGVGCSSSVPLLAVSWLVLQFAINCTYCVISAFLPDRVDVADRGRVSAWFGVGQAVGLLGGFGLVAVEVRPVVVLSAIAVINAVLTTPFLWVVGGRALQTRTASVAIRRTPHDGDFGKVWLVRFVATLANSMATINLFLYLETELRVADASTAGAAVLLLVVIGSIPAAVISGRASDRSGMRKKYVVSAIFLMSVAYVVLALWADFTGVVVAAVVLGVGYGIYLSVDQALIVDVLPDGRSVARDLGIVNLANAGPQVIAPVAAAAVLGAGGGYTPLYLSVAVITALGVIPLRAVKAVK